MEPRLEEAKNKKRVVYFVDAAHFVMGAFLGWLWSHTRIFIRTSSGRQRYNVLGALCATTHQIVTVCNTSYINSKTVCELLYKIKAISDLPITIVLDNARYQRCSLVQTTAETLGIELLFLPPYSPNLNLIERFWKFVKKHALYSKYYSTFSDFQNAINTTINNATCQHRYELQTLLRLKFQTFRFPQH